MTARQTMPPPMPGRWTGKPDQRGRTRRLVAWRTRCSVDGVAFLPLHLPFTFPSSIPVRPCSRCPPSSPSTLSARPHVLPSDTMNPLTRSRPSSTCCLFLLDTNPIPYIKICKTLDCPVQIALIRAVWPFTALLQDSRQDSTASHARAYRGVFVALVGIVV